MKTHFLIPLSLLVAFVTAFSAEKPNVLIILADDLGYGDLGCTGSPDIKTPNIDALAAEGVFCENGYVTHPYCGPCRAGLMAGRYQARFGLEVNLTNSPFDLHSGFPLTEKTFAERMKTGGYQTGIIGKWHLGSAPPYHPNNRGFDYFYGFLSGGHCYFPEGVSSNRTLLASDGKPAYSANEGSYWPLSRNNKGAEFEEYLTRALSKDAAKFVVESKKPFCLYLAYNAPHLPLEAPQETIAKYSHIEGKKRRVYAAMIDELDQGVGQVVSALKESGKFENTLIFFLSDNGGAGGPEKGGKEAFSSSGPFRDGKGSMREGGSHVPFLIHWPAGLRKTGRFPGLVSALDIAATVVALGGGDASGNKLEGKNLIPYLNGEELGSPHEALFWRKKDGEGWAVRTMDSKLLRQSSKGPGPEFYDMSADPYEKEDLIVSAPERRTEMARLWNEWNSGNVANIWLQSGEYQKKRLKMYQELYQKLEVSARMREPLVIE